MYLNLLDNLLFQARKFTNFKKKINVEGAW